VQNLSTLWVDANGGQRIQLLHLTDAAILTDGIVATSLGSNADWITWWGSAATTQTPAPVAATYRRVADVAALVFQDAGGNLTTVIIPAPKSTLFMADQETVDPADPTGAIANFAAILTTGSGAAAPTFVAGYRR
jgi:hypothetical protein